MEMFRPQRSPGSDRFLGLFSSTPPDAANGVLSSASIGEELDEDDIFSSAPEPQPEPNLIRRNDVATVGPNAHPTPPSPLTGARGFRRAPERGFGILAALPEEDKNKHTFLHRKATIAAASSSLSTTPSSSAARVIPAVPKPKPADFAMSVPSGKIYHQSAPVSVPMAPSRARKVGWGEVEEDAGENDEDEDEMLPPHEIVARASGSPMTTFSVLEGVGRTLKGRDLRRVRNAVWRKTGFID